MYIFLNSSKSAVAVAVAVAVCTCNRWYERALPHAIQINFTEKIQRNWVLSWYKIDVCSIMIGIAKVVMQHTWVPGWLVPHSPFKVNAHQPYTYFTTNEPSLSTLDTTHQYYKRIWHQFCLNTYSEFWDTKNIKVDDPRDFKESSRATLFYNKNRMQDSTRIKI